MTSLRTTNESRQVAQASPSVPRPACLATLPAVALVMLVLLGCAAAPRETAPVVYKSAGAQALLSSHNANAAKISTLSATLDMTLQYVEKGKTRKRSVEAWLDVEKPSRLRLKHDSIGRDLFLVVCDGARFSVALDRALAGEDTVYTGALDAVKGESLFRPDRLLSAFSLSPLPPEGASETVAEIYRDACVLSFLDDSTPRRVLARATFSRADLRLSRYQLFDGDSRLVLDVAYRSWQSAAGADVPRAVFIDWPLDEFSVLAIVSRPAVATPLPPRLWQFRWRKDAAVVDLDAAIVQLKDSPSKGE